MQRRLSIAGLVALMVGAVATGQGAQTAAPQTQTPTFKTQVEYVEVDVLVTDQQGRFVSDLKKEDFEVREDGKAQTISTFALVNIPVEREERPLFAGRPIEPDVQTNGRAFDGRIYVMILDDYHTDALRSQRVKAAARQFIEKRLGANDLMAVVTVGGGSDTSQEFTSSRRLLLAAVDRFVGQKLESATLTRNAEYYRTRLRPGVSPVVNDPDEFERLQRARSALRSIRDVAEWFGGIHGRRKTILLLSEGIDYDITNLMPGVDSTHRGATDVIAETREAIGAAQRANVSIYAIDARGLLTGTEDAIGVTSFAGDDRPTTISGDPTVGVPDGPLGIDRRSLFNEVRLSQESLRALAEETGGLAIVNRNNYLDAFERIVSDNSSYYVLAYYPPTDKRDGKFHKIDVRVRRQGLTVRARRGYMAPRGKPFAPVGLGSSPAIREALNSPLPVSGLTMELFTAPFKGTAPNASVLLGIELRGRDLSLGQNTAVDVSYIAIDQFGKVRGPRTDQLKLNLRPETKARVEQTGVRLLNRVELPPGRFRLRVAAHDPSGGAVGSVIADLDIPDFYKLPLSMSGLVVTSMAGSSMVTAHTDEQLKEVLPAPPIGLRVFQQKDELALFAEVYENSGSAPHRVDIEATVTADDGKVVFKNAEERESSELQGKSGGYGYAARVPLSDFPSGLYVLKVEARSRVGNRPAVAREMLFRISDAGR